MFSKIINLHTTISLNNIIIYTGSRTMFVFVNNCSHIIYNYENYTNNVALSNLLEL